MRDSRGFTLVELLIVIVIIGLVIAIAVPGLLRSRAASNEASAIGSLRAVMAAQTSYAAACGSGTFAPSLANLATGPTGGGDFFIGPDLASDPSRKSNYSITLTPGVAAAGAPASCNGAAAGSTTLTYFVAADPVDVFAGIRHFGGNQGGTIYESNVPLPVAQLGAPPGASPVQ